MSEASRIRIRCNGEPHTARVTAVDGEGVEVPLEGVVRSITWRVSSDDLATATIEFELVEIDAVGEVQPQ